MVEYRDYYIKKRNFSIEVVVPTRDDNSVSMAFTGDTRVTRNGDTRVTRNGDTRVTRDIRTLYPSSTKIKKRTFRVNVKVNNG